MRNTLKNYTKTVQGLPLKHKVTEFFRTLKYSFQRFHKGFCDEDIFNLDSCLQYYIIDCITSYIKNTDSTPVAFLPCINMTEEQAEQAHTQWKVHLTKILNLFQTMDSDSVEAEYIKINSIKSITVDFLKHSLDVPDMSITDYEQISEIVEKRTKDAFNELSKIYWDLWE